jgi:hypothetical protein
MENFLTQIAPQLGASPVFLVMAVYLFRFLMDSNSAFRTYLIERNKYLEQENKELRQALFSTQNPDAMRLSAALLSRAPITNIEA